MDRGVEICDVIGGHNFVSIHTLYQKEFFISLINSNNSDDIKMNTSLKNGDVCCGIGLLNICTISQYNESVYFHDMYGDVENSDVSGGNFL